MNSKKRHSSHTSKSIPKSIVRKKSYYQPFAWCCIALIAGIYVPLQFDVYYLEYTFVYLIVLPLCCIAALYFRYIQKLKNRRLCLYLWASFCATFSSYTIGNLIYTNAQNAHPFTSEIENAASSGYRSPASLSFKLDDKTIALVVNNENPVKEQLKQGHTVMIYGQYKKGLLSSVIIVDYNVDYNTY